MQMLSEIIWRGMAGVVRFGSGKGGVVRDLDGLIVLLWRDGERRGGKGLSASVKGRDA